MAAANPPIRLSYKDDSAQLVIPAAAGYDYERMVASPQTGENHIDFLKVSDELLNITYDDKPSAYTAISKYWKFIGGDFYGFAAYNLDKLRFWVGRCAIRLHQLFFTSLGA